MKFGFEFECNSEILICENDCYECDGCSRDYDLIYDELEESEHIITNIKDDGSISQQTGYEINSKIFESFNEFKDGLINLVGECKQKNHFTESPCAIHLHLSDHPKPLNFIQLCHSFDSIWRNIRRSNDNHLMHDPFSQPTIDDHPKTIHHHKFKNQNSPYQAFLSSLMDRGIADNRYHTIRNRISTLEFRPIPNRLSKQYIQVWLKIYEQLVKKSEIMGYNRILKNQGEFYLASKVNQLEKFKSFFGLDLWELWLLHHKIIGTNNLIFETKKNQYLNNEIDLKEFLNL